MIDIHTHILPYVDDGSPDINTSIELIKFEIQQGVTDIFVTPHYFKYRNYLSSVKKNIEIFHQLEEEIEKNKLNINIYLGNEIYYDSDTLKNLKTNAIKPLGDSNYALIEFSLFENNHNIPEAIYNLKAKGYIPIIAHPERYPYITDIKDYQYMKKIGARIQINVAAIIGKYGKRTKNFVFKLIKNNLVDFVASDIHSNRKSSMIEAYNKIKKSFSNKIADKIFNNREILIK